MYQITVQLSRLGKPWSCRSICNRFCPDIKGFSFVPLNSEFGAEFLLLTGTYCIFKTQKFIVVKTFSNVISKLLSFSKSQQCATDCINLGSYKCLKVLRSLFFFEIKRSFFLCVEIIDLVFCFQGPRRCQQKRVLAIYIG